MLPISSLGVPLRAGLHFDQPRAGVPSPPPETLLVAATPFVWEFTNFAVTSLPGWTAHPAISIDRSRLPAVQFVRRHRFSISARFALFVNQWTDPLLEPLFLKHFSNTVPQFTNYNFSLWYVLPRSRFTFNPINLGPAYWNELVYVFFSKIAHTNNRDIL